LSRYAQGSSVTIDKSKGEIDMTETTTISVHICSVCGDHAKEELETWENGVPDQVHQYYVAGIVLQKCDTCGLLACHSCMDDGYCCDRRAEIEMEGKPERAVLGRQQGLFE